MIATFISLEAEGMTVFVLVWQQFLNVIGMTVFVLVWQQFMLYVGMAACFCGMAANFKCYRYGSFCIGMAAI